MPLPKVIEGEANAEWVVFKQEKRIRAKRTSFFSWVHRKNWLKRAFI